MSKWYVYVDDCRKPDFYAYNSYYYACYEYGLCVPIICRTYDGVIDLLDELQQMNAEVILDLDHDLGESKTGYDICKYIVENQYPLLGFHIHSMNPVGVFNMSHLLKHYGYTQF